MTLLATRARLEVAEESERHQPSPELVILLAVPMPELGSGAIDGGRVRHMLSQARAQRADRVSIEGKRAIAHRAARCALSTCREPLIKAPEEAWANYRQRRCCCKAHADAYRVERNAARRRAMIEESEG